MFNLLTLMGAPAGGANSTGSTITTFVTIGAMILIFYFLLIRPQKKKEKEAKAMIAAMKKGDKVVSIGGIHGTVTAVKDKNVVVRVDDNTKLEFSKGAISAVLKVSDVKEVKEVTVEKVVDTPEEAPLETEQEK